VDVANSKHAAVLFLPATPAAPAPPHSSSPSVEPFVQGV